MYDNTLEALSVWDTPLFVARNPDHAFMRDALVAHIYQCLAQQQAAIDSQVAPRAKHQLYESTLDFLDAQQPEVMETKRLLEELLSDITTELNAPFWPEHSMADACITESWFHVTHDGGYHDVHSHPNCSWCGIYCVQAGACNLEHHNGVNRFYDPRMNADHFSDAGTAYLGQHSVWDFVPKEGQIIIFPSYLKHSALPYFGREDRIVIAFNACIDCIEA